MESLLLQINASGQHTSHPPSLPGLQQHTPDSTISPLFNGDASEATHHVEMRQLEDIGTSSAALSGLSDELIFEILPVDQIYAAYTQPRHQTSIVMDSPRIIIIPPLSEALTFFEIYVEHVDYLHHVLHLSKLRTQIHSFYDYLTSEDSCQHRIPSNADVSLIAPAGLILALFANAAACIAETQSKFPPEAPHTAPTWLTLMSITQARACTVQWVRATCVCLERACHAGSACIEDVQATILNFFLMYNLEGCNARARIGLGQGVAMARDLGLHRLDYPGQQQGKTDPVEMEIARRVWWYVCACDW